MLVRNPCVDDARVRREAATLAAAGWDVTVVATRAAGLPDVENRDGYRIVRVPVAPLHRRVRSTTLARGLEQVQGILLLADFTQRAARAVAGRSHQVVHAHDLNTLMPGWCLARAGRAALVYDSHELNLEAGPSAHVSSARKQVLRRYEGAFIRRADAVITVSGSLRDRLAATYGIDPPAVVLNCPPARPLERDGALRHALELTGDARLVVYHGRLTEGRALRQLVLAMEHLDGTTLALVGTGPLASELAEVAVARGISERVRLVAPVPPERVVRFVSAADAGVVPLEPTSPNNLLALPNKLFDYLMAGVPVAASDFPELRRVLLSDGVGAVFDPDAPRSIAAAVRSLLSAPNPDACRRRVHAVATARYAWERQAEVLLDVYARARDRTSSSTAGAEPPSTGGTPRRE